MSDFILEVNNTHDIIEIETSISDSSTIVEVSSSTQQLLEISTNYSMNIVYASDIVGLDNYLSNFIDNYQIDCGTP